MSAVAPAEPSAAALPDPRPMAEHEGVDRARFAAIRAAGQPAVLRGLASDWPSVAAARSGDEAFVGYMQRFRAPGPLHAIVGEPAIAGRFFYNSDYTQLNFRRTQAPFDAFMRRLLRDREEPKPYAVAIQSATIADTLPGFVEENPSRLLDPAIRPRMWIGNRIRVATHYDLMENVGVVVAGRRRFTLFPPDQMANLYPGPLELTPAGTPVSLVDIQAPDLATFPNFRIAAALAQVATLEPGDAIYIPFHWWHAVDSLAPVNMFVNYWWNDAPAGLGGSYDALLHAIYAIRNLPAEQRAAWRRTFDHYVFADPEQARGHLPPQAQGMLGPLTPTLLDRLHGMLRQIFARG